MSSLLDMITNSISDACLAGCRLLLVLAPAARAQLAEQGPETIAEIVAAHSNAREIGETVLRVFNQSTHRDIGPCLTFLSGMFGSTETANFFYPNDQKIMVNCLIRELEHVPRDSYLRKGFLDVVEGLIQNSSDYASNRHRAEALASVMQNIAESGTPVSGVRVAAVLADKTICRVREFG